MRKGPTLRLVAAAAALSLFATACGGSDDAGTASDPQPTTTTTTTTLPPTTVPPTSEAPMDDEMAGDDMTDEVVDPTRTGAASLRSLLTAQLQEHVYLAGIAVYAAVNTPDAFEAAAGALDQNSQDLAASIASVYGDDAGAAFLALWRTHIGFFVDYTTARAAGDEAAQAAAREGLDAYREDFGAFLESANPNLPKEAVAEELIPHVSSVFAAIDAVVDGSADGFDLLAAAAGHMPMTAAVLAAGIAAQFPDAFDGDVDSPASGLRSLLTAQLQEHVYLAGIAVYAAVNTPDAFEAAAGALDQNSQDLAASIASVYGDDAGAAFLALWRTHIGFFVDYTTARAAGDEAAQAAAREGLDAYREDFGAFLESANPNLPKEAVAEELIPHVSSVFAAIDAVVDGSADGFDLLAAAAGHMPMTAAVLAAGIAAQFPDAFGG
jgi:methylmalonyl-CoA mutase cobalamin-binding subunit